MHYCFLNLVCPKLKSDKNVFAHSELLFGDSFFVYKFTKGTLSGAGGYFTRATRVFVFCCTESHLVKIAYKKFHRNNLPTVGNVPLMVRTCAGYH